MNPPGFRVGLSVDMPQRSYSFRLEAGIIHKQQPDLLHWKCRMGNVALLAEADTWVTVGGWIVAAVVAILGPLATWLFSRKRGHYLNVTRQSSDSLIDLPDDFKKRMNVAFDGMDVSGLSVVSLRLTNSGSELLNDASVTIEMNSNTRILATDVTGNVAAKADIGSKLNTIHLTIPLLNSHQFHKESVNVSIICDGPASEIIAKGRGDNWSVKYYRQPKAIVEAVFFFVACAISLAWVSVFCASLLMMEQWSKAAAFVWAFTLSSAVPLTWIAMGGNQYLRKS